MEKNKLIKNLFLDLNESVNYVYFRDAKYLFDTILSNPKDDIDILIERKDINKLVKVLHKYNYITFQNIRKETRKIGFFNFKDNTLPAFDVQINEIHKLRYLDGRNLLKNKILENNVYVFNEKYKLLVLLLKDLFLISFFGLKPYSTSKLIELSTLYQKKENKLFLKKKLQTLFGNYSKYIIEELEQQSIKNISTRKNTLIFHLFVKNPAFLKHSLFNFIYRFYSKRHRSALVSILGVDGSGKSTAVEKLSCLFNEQNISHINFYMGRWIRLKSVKQLTAVSDKIHKKKRKKSFVVLWGRDLLYFFRYSYLLLRIQKNKFSKKFILTDRYAYDLLTQQDTTALLRFFVKYIYPKPNITILLYNKPEIIFSRKKEQTIHILKDNQRVFEKITAKNKGFFVKSDSVDKSFVEIINILLYASNNEYLFLKPKTKLT